MGARFIGVDREQVFLMPPSVRDWVPEGHLVWTVLDAVGELDLSAFYAAYRADGHGRPAYEPSMVVALLMYAYARGNRSSRGIERACVEDVAYRVVAGNLVPDHSTIADFRRRHEHALGEVFSGVLGLCARVGLASVGVVSIDGTKMSANASMNANRDFGQIARAILREAAEIDEREDELYGPDRGDELPEQLRTREGRRQALREAKERLNRERGQAAEPVDDEDEDRIEIQLDPQQFVTRPQGRRAWLRKGRRALEAQRERERRPIAGDRAERLFEACRRLEQELDADRAANAAYEHWRTHGVAADGSRRMAPGMVKPFELPELPPGLMNVTDPDSRVVRTQGQPGMQGYNAQLAVNDRQIIVAAEITTESPDFGHLEPMVRATQRELAALGLGDPDVVLADAGYWHQGQMQQIASEGIQVLVPPDAGLRRGPRPGWTGGMYSFMRRVLTTPLGHDLYRQRQITIEPVFGQIKFNRAIKRFQRRGRSACRSEWRLIAATHNLLKLHNHRHAATKRKHMKFLRARATLRNKRLPVRGRRIIVDLRGEDVGNYNVYIIAKYRTRKGKVKTFREMRALSVSRSPRDILMPG
jgi:transposase